jgi:hypothetical protein
MIEDTGMFLYWSILHTSNVIIRKSINWHILQFLAGQTAWLQHDKDRLHIYQMLLQTFCRTLTVTYITPVHTKNAHFIERERNYETEA